MASIPDRAVDLNDGDDEDEALRIAIALSLGRNANQALALEGESGKQNPIDLTLEDDDETASGTSDDATKGGTDSNELDHSSHTFAARPIHKSSATLTKPPSSVDTSSSASSLSIAGWDRKQMEAERLARLQKRKASELEKSPKSVSVRPSQRTKSESASLPERRIKGVDEVSVAGFSSSSTRAEIPHPHGVVKKTWAYGQPRRGDDIKIEEVLQKDKLQLAVLSSFQWDEEWLLSKIDISRTKMILIAFANNEAQKAEMRSNVPADRIRICFPPMQAMGCMHSKLQLLKYDNYMRIVVPTGNLVSYDWGETGTMENMVFIIDLAKFETAEQRDAQQLTAFGEDLLYFLRAQGLDGKLVDSLRNYDFSHTAGYGFVHTIAGSHIEDQAWRRTGYCGLGRAVSALGMASQNHIEFDYVCSSIGAVNTSFLAALYYACQGDSGLKEYSSRTVGGKSKGGAEQAVDIMLKEHARVYFPSLDTIVESKGGKPGAGTISFQRKWWQAASFPHWVLRDCKSTRKGLVMHSKVIFVRRPENFGNGFAYLGSANLSESAWGRLVKDRKTSNPKMTCRNWECGVLIRIDNSSSGQGNAQQPKSDWKIFETNLPIPMVVPGTPISADGADGKAPWFSQWGS